MTDQEKTAKLAKWMGWTKHYGHQGLEYAWYNGSGKVVGMDWLPLIDIADAWMLVNKVVINLREHKDDEWVKGQQKQMRQLGMRLSILAIHRDITSMTDSEAAREISETFLAVIK